ncbi:hypothetical protein BDF14DRAFT_1745657 [Spinellus fusiger]|nr:hypothetical protein BDF14DRAFT_1745657 [Spinellus fusiger]
MVRTIFSAAGLFLAFASTLVVAAPVTDSTEALSKRSSKYTGTGTWFIPETEGGVWGACGPKENSNSAIVALNRPQYGNLGSKSKWCGKKINIQGPTGKIVSATINDACPECRFGSLDLTPVLFKQVIGDMNKGVGKITWWEA